MRYIFQDKRYFHHTYDVDYIKINSPRLIGDGGAGGRASAYATPATPKRLLLNRSTNAMPGSEARLVRDIQIAFEVSADRYAAAPTGCAPACSAVGIISCEKEKSHSCELVLALFVHYLTSIIEKVHTPLVCARLL